MTSKQPAVYIMASKRNRTLYTGVTSDLLRRVYQHKSNAVDGFTSRNNVHLLVWFEVHEDMTAAIAREKQIKRWKRAWKLRLIEENNRDWKDLWHEIV